MKLYELAFACYVYGCISNYDTSYRDLLESTNRSPDLTIVGHRMALLEWLNKWGCRQFAKSYHDLASAEISDWYENFAANLPPSQKTLLELSNVEINTAVRAFDNLVQRKASMRRNKSRNESVVTVGRTGAAKILFAIRPNVFPPWDEPIREQLGESYFDYLVIVKAALVEFDRECTRNGIKLSNLPEFLERPTSSLVKLIDEYFWVTITNKFQVPSSDTLLQWANWE